MEMKYPIIAYAGILVAVVLVLLFVVQILRKEKNKNGINIANTELYKNDPYIKRAYISFYVLRVALIASLVGCIVSAFFLLARPYYIKKVNEEKYNRDIIICLDISSSVADLDIKLCKELQDTVRSLTGERIGIVMFNTSPVLLSPLSDDYEYTIQQLENIRTAIRVVNKTKVYTSDDWSYWENFLYSGTLVNNIERGSSLIGDGLLGGLCNFAKDSEDRTKIIIFATDNEPNGDGYLSLQKAADYCKLKDVTVYGIGTKNMYTSNLKEMKAAVESTGGKFYLEEDSSTFHNIVEEIESKSASLVKGNVVIREVESPDKTFKIFIVLFIISVVLSLILKRGNLIFALGVVASLVLIFFTYKLCIIPAHHNQMGPMLDVKRQSKYNVLFVIDDTISMVANDGRNGEERLDSVKADCKKIVEELDGANFSVITFNNNAMLLSPFNNNGSHIENVVDAIYPLQELYAKGSSLNTPKETMRTMLDSVEGKTCVFYFGDGENTSKEEINSFADLKDKIDCGAVIGYGTKQGGTMRVRSTWDDTYQDIMDYSTYPFDKAISRIDESNLKKLASDMGVPYMDMNGVELDLLLKTIKPKISVEEEITKTEDSSERYVSVTENKAYLLFVLIIILLVADTVYVIKVK